jgi:uncharacterized protein
MSRRFVYVTIAIVLTVGLLTGCADLAVPSGGSGYALAAGSPADGTAPRVINVTGSGRATSAPDIAEVVLGVEVREADPSAAIAESTARMDAVLTALGALGIEGRDIQTVHYAMWQERVEPEQPVLGRDTRAQLEERYVVVNQVRVVVRDLELVGEVLSQAFSAGTNSVGGIQFTIGDSTALQAQARDLAIASARAKAEQLAAGLGVTVGNVQTVGEYGGLPMVAAFDRGGFGGGGGMPISPGEFSVVVEVQVSFEIM